MKKFNAGIERRYIAPEPVVVDFPFFARRDLNVFGDAVISLGIDPSLTAMGLWMFDQGSFIKAEVSTKLKDLSRLIYFARYLEQIFYGYLPQIIVLEDYAYGARGFVHNLGELGGLIRLLINEYCHYTKAKQLLVSPTMLKKFATGKGNAKKSAVQLDIQKRYDIALYSDNEADAFVLSLIGFYIMMEDEELEKDLPKFQKEVLKQCREKLLN